MSSSLRLRSQTSSVPVLILSARSSAEDRARCKEAGADDYLTKPFDVVELLSRTQALLKQGQAPAPNIIRLGDLELDRRSRQVKRGGRCIELGSKEYRLLEFLMDNAGCYVSRDMILEHVWDHSFDAVINIVDVYISELSNKIDGTCGSKLLHTIRGVGYTIRECEHKT
jgi:DNA-binding response OmpR family regulator